MARSEVAEPKRPAESGGKGSLLELVAIVAIALGLALTIQAFLVKPFRIPSESMVPTLEVSQRVLVDRVSFRFSEPHRGDVVVFKPPSGAEAAGVDFGACGKEPLPRDQACPRPTSEQADANFIKRVVGEPGDRLKILEGRVYLNGRLQSEPFARPDSECPICNLPREITVPPGHFFMMGDNRGQSADSREWGPVPEEWIVGNAFSTYWPPRRIGLL
ncbi:MAG: signal peptidase I [Thermoleophilaceae bacterium]|nr:signal peptidase I [Thermoleophilaceae bacterium]